MEIPLIFAGQSRKMKGNRKCQEGRPQYEQPVIRAHPPEERGVLQRAAGHRRYIEEHSDKVAFMTASKLGATVGVSESTVVRFATEIGYSGYPALQQPCRR